MAQGVQAGGGVAGRGRLRCTAAAVSLAAAKEKNLRPAVDALLESGVDWEELDDGRLAFPLPASYIVKSPALIPATAQNRQSSLIITRSRSIWLLEGGSSWKSSILPHTIGSVAGPQRGGSGAATLRRPTL